MLVDEGTDVHKTGELALVGSLVCLGCGYSLSLSLSDELPSCPACGGSRFRRASMFESPTLDADAISAAPSLPAWLDDVRADLEPGNQFVAFEDGDEPVVVGLQDGWTRIGRSLSAHVRFDDPTVSRRHALLYCDGAGARILDDRSLNGVFRNGDRVELAELADGDEISIGRFSLFFVSVVGEREAAAATATAG